MNILPKKRWHVRTKENIARVRKDEAEAAAKAKEEQTRIENADREARLNVLKLKAKQKLQENCEFDAIEAPSSSVVEAKQEHVNLFSDLEHCTTGTNKEHDLEVKNKKEEYEKQIGYLTYLGQDTNESLGKKNWYDVLPDHTRYSRSDDIKETYTKLVLRDADGKPRPSTRDVRKGEVSWSAKQTLDPMKLFKKVESVLKTGPTTAKKDCKNDDRSEKITSDVHKKKKKHHKHKSNRDEEKAEKLRKLQKLREARLRRELEERRRARALLAAVSGVEPAPAQPSRDITPRVKPKYNSQFNPELARQNYT